MSITPQKIPYKIGSRVFINQLVVVGTVDKYELGRYLVRWTEPNKKTIRTEWFRDDELTEQLELFGGIFDV